MKKPKILSCKMFEAFTCLLVLPVLIATGHNVFSPGGSCYDAYTVTWRFHGEVWERPDIPCSEVSCLNGIIHESECTPPAMYGHPSCTLLLNPKASFPDCCPKVSCPVDVRPREQSEISPGPITSTESPELPVTGSPEPTSTEGTESSTSETPLFSTIVHTAATESPELTSTEITEPTTSQVTDTSTTESEEPTTTESTESSTSETPLFSTIVHTAAIESLEFTSTETQESTTSEVTEPSTTTESEEPTTTESTESSTSETPLFSTIVHTASTESPELTSTETTDSTTSQVTETSTSESEETEEPFLTGSEDPPSSETLEPSSSLPGPFESPEVTSQIHPHYYRNMFWPRYRIYRPSYRLRPAVPKVQYVPQTKYAPQRYIVRRPHVQPYYMAGAPFNQRYRSPYYYPTQYRSMYRY